MIVDTTGGLSPVVVNLAADFSKFTFSPVGFGEVGVHTVGVNIHDDEPAYTTFTMSVTVINDPPVFTENPLKSFRMPVNSTRSHSLADCIFDYESHPITMSIIY